MRLVLGCALVVAACSSSPPAPSAQSSPQQATAQKLLNACPACGPLMVRSLPSGREIMPELDPAAVARQLGHPEWESMLEEKFVTAQARVQSAVSDQQANAIVAQLTSDLEALAK